MTQTSALTAPARALGQILAAPFVGIARFIAVLADAHARMGQAERLSEKSDAQLAAAGKTRDGELRRILGVAAYS